MNNDFKDLMNKYCTDYTYEYDARKYYSDSKSEVELRTLNLNGLEDLMFRALLSKFWDIYNDVQYFNAKEIIQELKETEEW